MVNVTDTWSERLRSYLGRSRQRMELHQQMHMKSVVTTNGEKSAEVIVCDLKVATLIAEMLLLLSRSIPIGKCLVRNERCEATETK